MQKPLVAHRMESIPFAGIRRVFDKASKLEAEGRRVIHFESGSPDFDTPAHIKSAAMKALEEGMVRYTPNAGIPVLREAMADSIRQYKKLIYDPNAEIIITAGGQEAMYLGLQATINPGDEVLVPNPGFGLFFSSIRLVGGTPISLPLNAESGFVPDFEQAKRLVSERTRAVIVNSPHNPSGAVWSAKQIEAVCEFAKEFNLLLFSDEAYDRMLYEEEFISPAGMQDMKERTVILGSLSKTYAMTGWRIGYLAAPKEITDAATRVQQNLMLSLCAFAQAGAATALKGPQDCVDEMVSEFNKRRLVILKGIEQSPGLSCPVTPRGAFYFFVKHHVPGMDSAGVADYLLEESGVAVVPGTEFGPEGEGFFRISYARSMDDCKEGMDRIAEAMTRLMERS
jgi:aspartate/methionine/tyrosine aminotransferase